MTEGRTEHMAWQGEFIKGSRQGADHRGGRAKAGGRVGIG